MIADSSFEGGVFNEQVTASTWIAMGTGYTASLPSVFVLDSNSRERACIPAQAVYTSFVKSPYLSCFGQPLFFHNRHPQSDQINRLRLLGISLFSASDNT